MSPRANNSEVVSVANGGEEVNDKPVACQSRAVTEAIFVATKRARS